MKNKNRLLDEIRQEKEILRRECAEGKTRLLEHWTYLSDNAPLLLINSAASGIAGWLGFGGKENKEKGTEVSEPAGLAQTAWSGLMAYYPLVWEIVQPLLWRFAVKKMKSLFSGKKKKKRRDDDDEN
ncbi:MAG: hypothetical protein LBL79_07515 [Prevotella sp.]|jgi:hypothetical protein|nr:hypothetical protein [Prevotella sp.]